MPRGYPGTGKKSKATSPAWDRDVPSVDDIPEGVSPKVYVLPHVTEEELDHQINFNRDTLYENNSDGYDGLVVNVYKFDRQITLKRQMVEEAYVPSVKEKERKR